VAESGLDTEKTATDLAALNPEPAGAHGFTRIEAGHFADERGTRQRFFGVNLSGAAGLPDHPKADRLARYLRKLGFNAVRLHALDGPGGIVSTGGRELDVNALDRLDYLVSALKQQGLSFVLELHAVRPYAALDAGARARFSRGQVLDRFDPTLLADQKAFARLLLTHNNPFLGSSYASEPALLYLELNDEDTLLPSSGGSPDDAPESNRAALQQLYPAWLAERTAAGERAPGPALEEAKAELPTINASPSAQQDYASFLRSIELAQVKDLCSFIRTELGLHSLLVNTQASFGGMAGALRENEVSDVIDVHGVWDGPHVVGEQPALRNTAQFAAPDGGLLGVLGSYRVFGKPFSVSEYGSAGGNPYAAEFFPLLTAIAGLQDWDAVFAFAFTDSNFAPGQIASGLELAGHPTKLAFVTASALAFRQQLIQPARNRIELSVAKSPHELPWTENAIPSAWLNNGVALSTIAVRQLGIVVREGAGAPSTSARLRSKGALGSDTGELFWEPEGPHARFTVDAPSFKLACGELSDSALALGAVGVEFPSFALGFSCVTLVALDLQPIAQSKALLLTVAGAARNAHDSTPSEPTALAVSNDGPALAQYVPVSLSLPAGTWHATALNGAGAALRQLPVTAGSAKPVFTTSPDAHALSYLLTR